MGKPASWWGTMDGDGTAKVSVVKPVYSKTRQEWFTRGVVKHYPAGHTGLVILTKMLRGVPTKEAITEIDKYTLLPLSILRMIHR